MKKIGISATAKIKRENPRFISISTKNSGIPSNGCPYSKDESRRCTVWRSLWSRLLNGRTVSRSLTTCTLWYWWFNWSIRSKQHTSKCPIHRYTSYRPTGRILNVDEFSIPHSLSLSFKIVVSFNLMRLMINHKLYDISDTKIQPQAHKLAIRWNIM